MSHDGSKDIARAAQQLAARLPAALSALAPLALNYWWSWAPDGRELFREIDAHRFELCGENPVRLLQDVPADALVRVARDRRFLERLDALRARFDARVGDAPSRHPERPVAFLCLEYGIHPSLPIYSGGLGILAGDILKEASDRGLPMVALGLLYSQGSYHQRLDPAGWQHDYWLENDPEFLPMALVTGDDGEPLTVRVPIRGREVVAQAWRVDVGRVPLYLLDTDRVDNDVVDRWITSRLYLGDPRTRLSQYALLGVGGVRLLEALEIDPAVLHLNEGHPALAPLELAARVVGEGRPFDDALLEVRERTVFTTHTPVPAGNETYRAQEIVAVLPDMPERLGVGRDRFLGLGRVDPSDGQEGFGMTTVALRLSRSANGVSRRHGQVARAMWAGLYGQAAADGDVPIGHVTNGVHVPTWMAPAMRRLLDLYLGPDWPDRAADPETWAAVDAIPDEELWAVRNELRADLVAFARDRSARDRLARGESSDSVEAAREVFDPDALTIGFARRVALYKRLNLLIRDRARADRLLEGPPVQVLLAGKAHPDDQEAKRSLHQLFEHRWGRRAGLRVTFLEDYDLALARRLVAGCDLWLNLPRPPLEASGTSGMKVALNGGLNLSVLDGWWAEAYDPAEPNGWALSGDPGADPEARDDADGTALYDLAEGQVIPAFYERDEAGIPRAWLRRVRASLRSVGARFCATRMLEEYERTAYGLAPERRPS